MTALGSKQKRSENVAGHCRLVGAVALVAISLVAPGCGVHEDLIGIVLAPQNVTRVHDTPADSVQFTATGIFVDTQGNPRQRELNSVDWLTWKTSDPGNTTISAHGLATCINAALELVTITASATNADGLTIRGEASLTCE